jgi:hypothetical protein
MDAEVFFLHHLTGRDRFGRRDDGSGTAA